MEVNVNAKVWRFPTELEAHEQAIFLDGHHDNVIVHKSYTVQYGDTFLVIAWN